MAKSKKLTNKNIAIVMTAKMSNMAHSASKELHKVCGSKIDFHTVEFVRFANGEVKPQIQKNVRNKDIFLFFDFNGMPNEDFMNFILTLDALHLAGALRITPVIPYIPYLRQDRKDEPRSPISAAVIIRMITACPSIHRLITVDMHSDQLQAVFTNPVDHLPGITVFVPWAKKQFRDNFHDLVAVAPDFGSAKRVRKLANKIHKDVKVAIIEKERVKSGTEVLSIIGTDVYGKICFLNDDMMDTCETIIGAADALYNKGAKEVIFSATHAIFSNKDGATAYEKLTKAKVKVVVTDSLNTEEYSWLTVLPLGKYMAHVILQQITDGGSVSKLIRKGLPK